MQCGACGIKNEEKYVHGMCTYTSLSYSYRHMHTHGSILPFGIEYEGKHAHKMRTYIRYGYDIHGLG